MSKAKAQGTAFETHLVKKLSACLPLAHRLPEGGGNDAGDILLQDWNHDHWIIEAKHRANLNPHKALAKAKAKVETSDTPWHTIGTALIWKRLTRKGENERRTPDGEPVIVVLDLDTFIRLLQVREDI